MHVSYYNSCALSIYKCKSIEFIYFVCPENHQSALTVEVEIKVAQGSLLLLEARSLKAVREQVYSILLLLERTSGAVDVKSERRVFMPYDVRNNLYANSGLMEKGGGCLSDAVEHVQPTKGFGLQTPKLLTEPIKSIAVFVCSTLE